MQNTNCRLLLGHKGVGGGGGGGGSGGGGRVYILRIHASKHCHCTKGKRVVWFTQITNYKAQLNSKGWVVVVVCVCGGVYSDYMF